MFSTIKTCHRRESVANPVTAFCYKNQYFINLSQPSQKSVSAEKPVRYTSIVVGSRVIRTDLEKSEVTTFYHFQFFSFVNIR